MSGKERDHTPLVLPMWVVMRMQHSQMARGEHEVRRKAMLRLVISMGFKDSR